MTNSTPPRPSHLTMYVLESVTAPIQDEERWCAGYGVLVRVGWALKMFYHVFTLINLICRVVHHGGGIQYVLEWGGQQTTYTTVVEWRGVKLKAAPPYTLYMQAKVKSVCGSCSVTFFFFCTNKSLPRYYSSSFLCIQHVSALVRASKQTPMENWDGKRQCSVLKKTF